ncbi:MAG: dephospho-CoA kinase [Lentisphaerae bacterium GWF2_45_14]|nr:MAG: dephospho-CoA kinase [Lentisphaerae bacterium GWF2_45_14]
MLVGLTGGVGCGKSTVLKIFGELGWFTIDADSLVHEIYRDKSMGGTFLARWGEAEITDSSGNIDRKKIAEIVFNNQGELEWLESVLHPAVFERSAKIIGRCKSDYIMFDVPLLYEKNKAFVFDLIISIWTEQSVQYKRLMERSWSINDIESRNLRQFSQGDKLERADLGIINSGPMGLLREQCKILDKKMRTIQYGKKKISDR